MPDILPYLVGGEGKCMNFATLVCFLPSVWILWSSVSGMSSSSWPLLLAVWEPTADGLKTWLQLSPLNFCHFMNTSGNKHSRGHPDNHEPWEEMHSKNSLYLCGKWFTELWTCNHWQKQGYEGVQYKSQKFHITFNTFSINFDQHWNCAQGSKFHTFPYRNFQASLRVFFFREYATSE